MPAGRPDDFQHLGARRSRRSAVLNMAGARRSAGLCRTALLALALAHVPATCSPPPAAVTVSSSGSLLVDGQPLFPTGFYYMVCEKYALPMWNGSALLPAEEFWRSYTEELGFSTFVHGWCAPTSSQGGGWGGVCLRRQRTVLEPAWWDQS